MQMKLWHRALGVAAILGSSAMPVFAKGFNHAPWDGLAERFVADGRVDYAAINKDRPLLSAYLVSIREADPSGWPRQEQIAFWINAYNACVFKAVLDYPNIKSVKEVKGFFDRLTFRVAGKERTLNQIENAGRALGDWRIHFAVVCASASCPPIRPEAYQAEWLDAQLAEQVKLFLANRKDGMRLEGETLWVSSIFKWYAKDFIPGGRMNAENLLKLLTPYLPADIAAASQEKKLSLKLIDYDWSLNRQGSAP